LEDAGGDQDVDVGRGAADQRCGREPDGPDDEHAATPEAVSERAADQDQRREREQVPREDPLK